MAPSPQRQAAGRARDPAKMWGWDCSLDRHIAPDQRASLSVQFQKKTGDVPDERVLDVAFMSLGAQAQEVEYVGILQGLVGQFCARLRKVVSGTASVGQQAAAQSVRGRGLEPPLLSEPDPKSGASTSSAILACDFFDYLISLPNACVTLAELPFRRGVGALSSVKLPLSALPGPRNRVE